MEIDGISYIHSDLEEGFYLENDSFHVYLDGEEQTNDFVAPIGTISDQSNILTVGYNVYSTTLNFRTEEEFLPTANIGYVKQFTSSDFSTALKNTKCSSQEDAFQIFTGFIGETIVLNYLDENGEQTLPEGSKISLDLSFNDIAYGGSSYWYGIYYNSSSGKFSSIESSTSLGNVYCTSDTSFLDIRTIGLKSTSYKVGFGNEINVYTVDSEGEKNLLGTYYDLSGINSTFTADSDVTAVYIDVQYNLNYLYDVYENYNKIPIPNMFKLDLSGNISVDTSGVNTGLLKGIIEWLRNILNAINALPQKIADLVIDGLKTLFIPSAEDIATMYTDFKDLADSKLGFLAQIFNMVVSFFQSLADGAFTPTEQITIPRLSLPFKYVTCGELVIWEEMTFNLIPEGLDYIQTLSCYVTSIIIVLATINTAVTAFRRFFNKE